MIRRKTCFRDKNNTINVSCDSNFNLVAPSLGNIISSISLVNYITVLFSVFMFKKIINFP